MNDFIDLEKAWVFWTFCRHNGCYGCPFRKVSERKEAHCAVANERDAMYNIICKNIQENKEKRIKSYFNESVEVEDGET